MRDAIVLHPGRVFRFYAGRLRGISRLTYWPLNRENVKVLLEYYEGLAVVLIERPSSFTADAC